MLFNTVVEQVFREQILPKKCSTDSPQHERFSAFRDRE